MREELLERILAGMHLVVQLCSPGTSVRRSLYAVRGHLGKTEGTAAVFGERMAAPPLLLSLTDDQGRVTTKGLVRWLGEMDTSDVRRGTAC